jgi:transposase
VSLIPNVGKTWAFPDMKPLARVSGRRGQNVGVTGAVNPGGRFFFEMTRKGERFTAIVFLRFIRNLRREYPKRRVTLIVDGAPVHTAKIVKEFLGNNRWLHLEYLPTYSPEWNPAEKPWGYLKGKARNGSQSRNAKELRNETRRMLNRLKKKDKQAYVKSFFVPPI